MMKQSFWALAAAFSFALMAALVKLCSGEFGSLELVFYRSVFGMASIAVFVFSGGQTLKTAHLRHHLVRSFLGVVSVGLWFFALSGMKFGTNMTLIYTTPLFMAANFVILAKIRQQKAPWGMVAAILAGFAGITMVLRPEFHQEDFVPGLICLLVAFIDLIVYWQMKLMGRLGEPSWRIVFYFSVLGAVFAAAGQVAFSSGFHVPSAHGALCLVGIGALATVGQLCSTRSYAYGNMLLSSCLGFSAIPFSVILGVLIFDDAVTAGSLAAISIVLASGMAASVYTKKTEKQFVQQ